MILEKSFNLIESSTFGPLLARFKSTFSSQQLESPYMEVNDIFLKTNNNGLSIMNRFTAIKNKSLAVFKEFILSNEKVKPDEKNYDYCRLVKKVPDIHKLLKAFSKDNQYEAIEASTHTLLNDLDDNGNIYYAIAKNFQGSTMENLPTLVVGHIFHYVDGDINI